MKTWSLSAAPANSNGLLAIKGQEHAGFTLREHELVGPQPYRSRVTMSLVRGRRLIVVFSIFLSHGLVRAETGGDAWLRYAPAYRAALRLYAHCPGAMPLSS